MKHTPRHVVTLFILTTFLVSASVPPASGTEAPPPLNPISDSIERIAARPLPSSALVETQPTAPAAPATAKRSAGRKALGAVLGGVVGFFAGVLVGGAVQGDCDDSECLSGPALGGLVGLIGGATAGAALAGK
jgi:hypothetical protein